MIALPDQVRELLLGRNFASLATLLPDGSPHSVSVWAGLEGDHVTFFTQPQSRKARNLERDPRVAMSLVDYRQPYRTGHLRGRFVEVRTGEEALVIIDKLAHKYTGRPFPMRSGNAYLVEPTHAGAMTLPFTHEPA